MHALKSKLETMPKDLIKQTFQIQNVSGAVMSQTSSSFLSNTWGLILFGSALPTESSLRKSNVPPNIGLRLPDPSAWSYTSSLEPDVAKLLDLDHLSLSL